MAQTLWLGCCGPAGSWELGCCEKMTTGHCGKIKTQTLWADDGSEDVSRWWLWFWEQVMAETLWLGRCGPVGRWERWRCDHWMQLQDDDSNTKCKQIMALPLWADDDLDTVSRWWLGCCEQVMARTMWASHWDDGSDDMKWWWLRRCKQIMTCKMWADDGLKVELPNLQIVSECWSHSSMPRPPLTAWKLSKKNFLLNPTTKPQILNPKSFTFDLNSMPSGIYRLSLAREGYIDPAGMSAIQFAGIHTCATQLAHIYPAELFQEQQILNSATLLSCIRGT